ncbi:MAG: hypothetical protein HPY59_18975 [Anaerolineae bacterium]|nr:hypothetical protein [Anaerolineae bacterium]
MGTSKSYGGPGNRSPLLPPWADGETSPLPNPNPDTEQPGQDNPGETPTDPSPERPETPLQSSNWATTSRHFSTYASGGGGGSLGKALSSYTQSKGGSRQASKSARTGRKSTAKLGGFLSSVATSGVRVATEGLGLASTILGMPVELALGAILDAIVPDGATPDDSAARRAINATLEEMYNRFELGEGNLSKLEAIDSNTAKELIIFSVTSYIFEKFLQDLQYCFEEGNIAEDEVIRLEREVHPYIEATVKVDLLEKQVDVLTLNWSGVEGQRFCDEIYSQAYALLEDKK